MITVCSNKSLASQWMARSVLILLAAMLAGCGQADHSAQIEAHKRLAAELENNNLPQAAVEEYRKVLTYDDLNDTQRGNINYLIARIYYERLKDFRNAAAHYIRAREYNPDGSFATEATKNLVASLEKLGNVLDARRQLGSAANFDHQPSGSDDKIVARIGERDIWLSEVEDQISLMPPDVQSQLVNAQAKIEYVHQYVGVELLYNAAVREDYLANPDVEKQKEQLVKRLLVDRFVSDKVMPEVQMDTLDVRNFYLANRDDLYEGAPFDSVRARAYRDCQAQKAEAAYNEYIMRLAQVEKVEFLDHNVR